MKRRKQKELARKTIRHALSKNGVKNYKDIYDDFWYWECLYSLKIIGKI